MFLVTLIGTSALLMAPWPPVERVYARMFASGGDLALRVLGGRSGLLGSSAGVALVADTSGRMGHDVRVGLVNLDRGIPDGLGRKRLSSRHLAYMPAVTLLALVLATPLGWRRRARACLFGLLWVHVFVALRFTLFLLDAFNGVENHCLFYLINPWHGLLDLAANVLAKVPATTYVVPLVIWALVAVDRDVVERLTGSVPG
ncbi:MAG: hypothetical protein GY716_19975 [bacterium]|nr:hypothetical protein [bacterium]